MTAIMVSGSSPDLMPFGELKNSKTLSDIPENGKLKQNSLNLDNMLNNQKTSDADMTQSDAGFTTWSQLKKSSETLQMQRLEDLNFSTSWMLN